MLHVDPLDQSSILYEIIFNFLDLEISVMIAVMTILQYFKQTIVQIDQI